MKKNNYNDVKYFFEQRGYELVSTEYINCETPLKYICNKHRQNGIQDIDYNHFKRGQGCRFCGKENKKNGRQKDLSEYHAETLTESKGMEFVKITREDSKLYIYYICPKHRNAGVQKTPLESMRRKKIGCPYCIGRNKTTDDFVKEMKLINNNIEILGEYISATDDILCRCKIDGTEWNSKPNNLLHREGCPECGRINSNKNSTKSNEQFLLELNSVNPDIIPLETYCQAKIPIKVRCKKCGHEWCTSTPDTLLKGVQCPRCTSSKNEQKLYNILSNFGYQVETQKTYHDCRDILPLPFDLYIDELNLLIEYDGEQHYVPIRRGSMTDADAEKQLKITQKHDSIKTQYCLDNNIVLIRIPYWENKNLETFLLNECEKYDIPLLQYKMII